MSTTFDPLAGQRPAPIQLNFSKPFWDGAKDKKLMLQFCPKAGKYQFYPRPVSVYTGSRELEWREASGKRKIYAFSFLTRHRRRSRTFSLTWSRPWSSMRAFAF